jgi:hypothetical protein
VFPLLVVRALDADGIEIEWLSGKKEVADDGLGWLWLRREERNAEMFNESPLQTPRIHIRSHMFRSNRQPVPTRYIKPGRPQAPGAETKSVHHPQTSLVFLQYEGHVSSLHRTWQMF